MALSTRKVHRSRCQLNWQKLSDHTVVSFAGHVEQWMVTTEMNVEPKFTQFDRQLLRTMHVSLDSAQVEEEKPLRSSGEMLTVALMHPNGGITHHQFTARTEAQAWLNNNRKIGQVFVIISNAEAFPSKPGSSDLGLTRHDRAFFIASRFPIRLSWQDGQHDRLVYL